jgi:hypothetical protein
VSRAGDLFVVPLIVAFAGAVVAVALLVLFSDDWLDL